ncbi:intestinal mucin-like protein [Etheostoma spectabile]|uniref:intestinal mucin-like protein n=1 Tax=Etheostoma spectabile TaxID=54343 RepID=UPI0013AF2AEC|nr:intestinal mucin-like protein [Etheostoma spectabile]
MKLNTVDGWQNFVPANDKCVQYTCEKINGQLVTKETKSTCPPFNPLDCEPGTETTDSNGCCKRCKLRSICEVQSKQTVITVNDCKSTQLVNMSSCGDTVAAHPYILQQLTG